MWQAIEAVKKGAADCAVSAGNTGALMAMAKFCLHTMAPIERPAIAAMWPTLRGESIVLDVGATIGGDAQHLVDLAIMGAAMARIVFDIDSPTVGLLNVGVEEIKGVEEVKAAGRILREANLPNMRYHGFVEGDDLGKGAVDVFVTEGFTGNIALKTAEGTARQLGQYMRDAMGSQPHVAHRLPVRRARRSTPLRDQMAPRANGGVFLGLDGVVIKAHGGADADSYAGAVELGYDMVRQELLGKIREMIAQANEFRPAPAHRASPDPDLEHAPLMNLASPPPQPPLAPSGPDLSGGLLLHRSARACAASAPPCPRASSRTQELAGEGRHLRRVDRPAHRHPPALYRRRGRDDLDAGEPRRPRRRSPPAASKPADIDLIIVATSTPDYTFPASRPRSRPISALIHGVAFDLQAVCTGFVFAVATADKFLRSGSHKRALVIGAETFSRILDWNDRTTCVLFGDGAGAIVLEARESDGRLGSPGVIASRLRSDGRHRAKLYVDGGPSTTQTVGHLRMEGKEVFRHAVGMVTDVIQGCFADAGCDGGRRSTGSCRIRPTGASSTPPPTSSAIPRDKVVVTVDRHGNTSAASIPLALAVGGRGRAHQAGRPRDDRGDGRRLHLGRGADPLVSCAPSIAPPAP